MKIYLIQQQNTNFYKIGVSNDPQRRVNDLQTGNQETLILVKSIPVNYNFKTENALHKRYASQNLQLEWFELTKEQVDKFEDYCRQIEANFLLLEEQNTYLQDRYERGTH